MQKQTTPIRSWVLFMQLFDSSFPSGSFVHSFGLESHVLTQKVQTENDLRDFLLNLVFHQYIYFEFVQIKKIYNLLSVNKNNLEKIKKLDADFVSHLTYEYAKATKDLGANYLAHVKPLLDVQEYVFWKNNNISDVSFLSFLSFKYNFHCRDFCLLWAKKSLMNIAGSVPKISRIKPSAVQKILLQIDDVLTTIDFNKIENKISNFNPLFEEVVFSHKNLEPKMFVT